ncbi:MAG: hypothetical protein AAGG81_02015 [Chlamydiota bacterium]
MDFTRQPIIETVITAKEGCKLVIRSSKSAGQEEYFVDAIEVVSFGSTFFFRSQEKPKSFLVPASDYEVLEVREARMVLKNVGMNRSIKIGGGKDKGAKDTDKASDKLQKDEEQDQQSSSRQTERKRDRRRSFRRRKRGDEQTDSSEGQQVVSDVPLIPPPPMANQPLKLPERREGETLTESVADLELSTAVLNSLLPPPPNLISDTIEKYKDNKLFEGVFVGNSKQEEQSQRIEEETIEDVELAIGEEGCTSECFDEPAEFTEEQEQQIVEQRQKFEQMDDPLMSEPYQATESFTEEPSPDIQGDEVSSSNATQ